MAGSDRTVTEHPSAWTDDIPDEQWAIYAHVIHEAQAQGLRFALGGAFASATYTGHWRNTKDLDFYVLPEDREAMIRVVTHCGLNDYFDELEYDRGWIYRAHQGEIIVDVIWAMANRRSQVDEQWLSRGPEISVRGEKLRIVPVEEMIWGKIYIVHRDRCDWPDLLNMIYAAGPTLDWQHLLDRLGEDAVLLTGVLSVFTWLCPGRSQKLPAWLWERLPTPRPNQGADIDQARVNFVDSRPWFMALLPPGEPALQ